MKKHRPSKRRCFFDLIVISVSYFDLFCFVGIAHFIVFVRRSHLIGH